MLRGLWDLSSLTRDWKWATAVKVPNCNHWIARKFPHSKRWHLESSGKCVMYSPAASAWASDVQLAQWDRQKLFLLQEHFSLITIWKVILSLYQWFVITLLFICKVLFELGRVFFLIKWWPKGKSIVARDEFYNQTLSVHLLRYFNRYFS